MFAGLELVETIITIPRMDNESEVDFVQRVSDAVHDKGCVLIRIIGTRLALLKSKSNGEAVHASSEFLSNQIEVDVEIDCG
jgi:hypothetical protein